MKKRDVLEEAVKLWKQGRYDAASSTIRNMVSLMLCSRSS